MTLTIDQNGKALAETVDGITMPFWGGIALFLAIIAIVFLFAGIATVLKSR